MSKKQPKIKIEQYKKYLVQLPEIDAEYLRIIAKRKGISRYQYMSQQLSLIAQRERNKAQELFKPS